MRVVLIGASGNAGSRILNELQNRQHEVTAVVRHPEKLPSQVKSIRDDLSDVDRIAEVIRGCKAVVSGYKPPDDDTDQIISVTKRLIEAIRNGGDPRLVVVGGAASLEVAPGITALASGQLPPEWVPIATSHGRALEVLRNSDINWTYFSPAPFFEAGERTGKFRLGTNQLMTDESGNWARISFEDYAVALVDELEHPAHERAQFTVGY